MSTATHRPGGPHPIVWFGARVHEVLEDLAGSAAWSMTAHEQRQALVELARAEARIGELRLRLLSAADRNDIAADCAATCTSAWLAVHTGTTRARAHAEVRLAPVLDGAFAHTRRALAARRLNQARARVIVAAIADLPDGVDSTLRERAERRLVDDAVHYDAAALRLLGRRGLEVIEPRRPRPRGRPAARAGGARRGAGHLSPPVRQPRRNPHRQVQDPHPARRDAPQGPVRADRPDTGTSRRPGTAPPRRPGTAPPRRPGTAPPTWRPARNGWVRRSASSSNGSPPTGYRRRAGCPRPCRSCSTTTSSSAGSAPHTSTPACPSRPAKPAAWRAAPASSRWPTGEPSTAGPWSSTLAVDAGCTTRPSASRSPSATAAAPPSAAIDPPPGATPTTTPPGHKAAEPASPTADCSAASTTPTRTPPTTTSPTATTATSSSAAGRNSAPTTSRDDVAAPTGPATRSWR